MTIPEWKASHLDRDSSRSAASVHVSYRASSVATVESKPTTGVDAAPDSRTVPATAPAKYLNRIAVGSGERIVLVSVSDVLWIQSHGSLLRLHLDSGHHDHRMALKDMYIRLNPELFLRVHRSVIVNLDYVTEFDLPRHGNAFVHLSNGKSLPISRNARLVLKRELLSLTYRSSDAGNIDDWPVTKRSAYA
jgi:DNA-binding LytR/AlgR family response regulator